MYANKRLTAVSGFLYLLVIVTGMFSLAYVPKRLIDWNNAETTVSNISAHPFLFRLGIYSSVLCYIAFTFLPLTLYKLLKELSVSYATAMVVLALLSVTISFNNLQHCFTALTLTGNEPSLTAIADRQDMLMLSLHQYSNGILLASLFWGLWLFPFGVLVYRSGFVPRLFGVLLMLGCLGYLVNFTGNTLVEKYAGTGVGKYMAMLPAVAEISICGWLLFFGLKTKLHGK